MRFARAIQRDIHMKFQVRMSAERTVGNIHDAIGLQTVRRKVDVTDTIVPDKKIDDFRQFAPKRRLTAAEPEIGKRRRRF